VEGRSCEYCCGIHRLHLSGHKGSGSRVSLLPHHSTVMETFCNQNTVPCALQTGQNSSQGQADERMMQLLRLLNRPLERSPETRRRNLAWYTPIIVPVWPQVREGWGGGGSVRSTCVRSGGHTL
jgi:hypothetical protein